MRLTIKTIELTTKHSNGNFEGEKNAWKGLKTLL